MAKKKKAIHKHKHKAIIVVFTCECGDQIMANVPENIKDFLSLTEKQER